MSAEATWVTTTMRPPLEGWERVRAAISARVVRVAAERPGILLWAVRLRACGLWLGVVWLLVMVAVSSTYRGSLAKYLACLWILLLWFVVTRTKTVRFVTVARMFALGMVWSWVIAWTSFALTHAVGLRVGDAGPRAAIAGMTEESLKLVPLLVLAVLAPGRVRRFAAVDWLLLALASGLGFQAWEEVMRRLALAVSKPGLLDMLFGTDRTGPGSGWPQYGWGLLSGGSGYWSGDDVWAYPGHHVETALVGACAGLGVKAWRWSRASNVQGVRFRRRVLGVVLPVAAFFVVIVDHVGNNAALYDRNWAEAANVSAPWVIREGWSVLGHGTGRGWLLLMLLIVCLLVDGTALHRAGPLTDLVPAHPGEGADAWWHHPNMVIDRIMAARAGVLKGPARSALAAGLSLGLHAGRDLALMVAAHLPEPGEYRRHAIARGRAAVELSSQVRCEALSAVLDPPVADVAGEAAARRRFRLLAGLALALVVLTGTVGAALVARRIGADLTPGGGLFSWLAGQFDSLATWWATRSTGQKILLGVGVAALVALSGGSLGLAFGVSGAATYLAEHGHGTADFLRNPTAATRSYLSTTTPVGAAMDLAEFGLTFAPGNFAGAAAGRGIRGALREYADDPAAFLARRRAAMTGDRGAAGLGEHMPGWTPVDTAALGDYTGPGFRDINPRLRTGEMDAAMQARVDAVSHALAKLPPHEGVVYRGTNLKPEQLAQYQPGEVVTEKAFLSTSMKDERIFKGNVRFIVDSLTGKDIGAYSQYPHQAEVLFDHGTRFKVLSHSFNSATGKTEIYLREVSP